MADYNAPTKDMLFALTTIGGFEQVSALPRFSDTTRELVSSVLEGAARLAGTELAPLNRVGDEVGAQLRAGQVIMPPGFAAAYRRLVEDGWISLPFPTDEGGQGLPGALFFPVAEMIQSANLAFSMCPLLAPAAVSTLRRFASKSLQSRFIPPLVSGQWSPTMALTESAAGSDLSAVSCRALPDGDHFRLLGQKQFISFGDHDMADNIVHLVLARISGAEAGVKGLSLFIVPKFLADTADQRNDVQVIALEHKLGLRASPTCTLEFGGEGQGAVGYLVGEAGQGLAIMFTMMNHARLQVGSQGAALVERAYQQSLAYARERIQGSRPDRAGPVAIIEHPDVRRMLMSMKAGAEAIRALVYHGAVCMDLAEYAEDPDLRESSHHSLELMTPVIKGWATEFAQELVGLAIQIHGGMGYIEETGVSQYLRDARIITIYEGTTGIQAQDLVRRKLLRDRGAAFNEWTTALRARLTQASSEPRLPAMRNKLGHALDRLVHSAQSIIQRENQDPGPIAYDFLMQTGTVAGGFRMFESAVAAERHLRDSSGADDFYRTKISTAQFYINHLLPRAEAHAIAVLAGGEGVMAVAPECM